jgi:hypothetical protein
VKKSSQSYLAGLSPEQAAQVAEILPKERYSKAGWFVYREPTTLHPPTVLRVFYRSLDGRMVRSFSVTERERI